MNGSAKPRGDSPRDVLIVQNPKAGARSGRPVVSRLTELLRREGLRPQVVSDLSIYSKRVVELRESRNLLAVVAAGGDGTVSLLVNHTPSDVPIAICPLGTENLLAKQVGVSENPTEVCDLICTGETLRIDAAEANGRTFLLMAGCGFDAEVVRRMHQNRKGHINRWSYAKPIIDSIRSYQYPRLRVYCDAPSDAADPGNSLAEYGVDEPAWRNTHPISTSARWVFIVNLPRYAGGLQIAPDASGSDGLLDVCTFEKGSLLNGLRYLGGVVLGRHQQWNDFKTRRATRIRIESDEPVPYQLDGDPGGLLPVDIRILPAHAALLVPKRLALNSAVESGTQNKTQSP